MSDIKQDYQKAQALAKQGKYEQARKLLIVHDHPKTNALLSKVNDAINAKPQKKTNGCVRLLAALVLAVIILWILNNVFIVVPL
jgi:hypothetical protein